jgi:hypothetical protein
MEPLEIRYAKSGEARIAYQVVGGGDLDLVWVPGFVTNLELAWVDSGRGPLHVASRFVLRPAA